MLQLSDATTAAAHEPACGRPHHFLFLTQEAYHATHQSTLVVRVRPSRSLLRESARASPRLPGRHAGYSLNNFHFDHRDTRPGLRRIKPR